MKSPKNKTSPNCSLSDTPCDGCKLHHRKCSRDLTQCSNCEKRGVRCTYLTAPKRRGPKTKVDSMLEYCESISSSLLPSPASSIENKPIVTNCITSDPYPAQSLPLPQYQVNPMLYPSANSYPPTSTTLINYQYLFPYYFNYQTSWLPTIQQNPFEMDDRLLYINPYLSSQSTNNNTNNNEHTSNTSNNNSNSSDS
ncbi:hypothetical protein CONCODRAFT_3774 [Conidiobolus coronatus NRRL 28638]|uniref:Zn(2)-C6 fungal-type domain-containing protein n=1 Tax=Conidiobolus coronatus (strain ATCC 28846 / CBS 209.66 / NRRL 28638) TaxID=796925 RepID=A0A137PEA1_CONC2|nr:hypothetical protein CONCODRAFT_3774 [Conidiobolus coronatus NRRL 28638]|eukprot:KXN73295.1 hypothetical protein CONCODRAFT_3774 [Conidiobolus coronatus NRRL 28638]